MAADAGKSWLGFVVSRYRTAHEKSSSCRIGSTVAREAEIQCALGTGGEGVMCWSGWSLLQASCPSLPPHVHRCSNTTNLTASGFGNSTGAI